MKLKKIPNLGDIGCRMRDLNPDFRAFVIEVLKATVVYYELLSADERDYSAQRRADYATYADNMVMMNEDVAKFGWIAKKLNLIND